MEKDTPCKYQPIEWWSVYTDVRVVLKLPEIKRDFYKYYMAN